MPAKSLSELTASLFPSLERERPDSALPRPIRSTRRAAQWSAGIHQAYAQHSARRRDPRQQAEIDRLYEQTLQDGPDFARVRRNAAYAPAPVVAYRKEIAATIMKQAEEIEDGTYASRRNGQHGGVIGVTALRLLRWFCFTMWPKARLGMFPSLEHIAAQARMSKDAAVNAIRTLELHGFLTVIRRRKRVQTAFGVKQVQDTNAYVLNLAQGLGAMALAAIGKASESIRTTAKAIHSYISKTGDNFEEPESEKYGFWGQVTPLNDTA
mgnify:CR=1 FL=1